MEEFHDTVWAGTMVGNKHYALPKQGDYWPSHRKEVMQFTNTHVVCHQDNVERAKLPSLLEPFHLSSMSWDSISLDLHFITHFLTFILTPKICSCEMTV